MGLNDCRLVYQRVSENISRALTDISAIKISNPEGNAHLEGITAKLNELHVDFSRELQILDSNSEWERFAIAFFGETNAGKSTIIESLRILLSEESRQKMLQQNRNYLLETEKQFIDNRDELVSKLNEMCSFYRDDVISLADEVSKLSCLYRREVEEISISHRDECEQLAAAYQQKIQAQHEQLDAEHQQKIQAQHEQLDADHQKEIQAQREQLNADHQKEILAQCEQLDAEHQQKIRLLSSRYEDEIETIRSSKLRETGQMKFNMKMCALAGAVGGFVAGVTAMIVLSNLHFTLGTLFSGF